MKQTTKEQVTVTLLVDLEYENQEDRASLILAIKDQASELNYGFSRFSMGAVGNSVTVSSNDESTIRAWKVQYRNLKPVIVRTVSEWKAKQALIKLYNLEGDDADAVTVVPAPEFTWNSNLLAGDVYSLEHAEAGNKKQ